MTPKRHYELMQAAMLEGEQLARQHNRRDLIRIIAFYIVACVIAAPLLAWLL